MGLHEVELGKQGLVWFGLDKGKPTLVSRQQGGTSVEGGIAKGTSGRV